MDGCAAALRHIETENRVGLEFGPLTKPIVPRSVGEVRYVDVSSTAELREKYRDDPNIDVSEIVDVDFVWIDGPLLEVAGREAPFDYAVAAHVVEHVPDPIWWWQQIHSVLADGGVLVLAIPDKRFSFDCQRPESTAGEMVEAYVNKSRRPSLRQLFDHHAYYAPVTSEQAWSPDFDASNARRLHADLRIIWDMCRESQRTGCYFDSHCYVYTPRSFLGAVEMIVRLRLFPFALKALYPTDPGQMQFFVVLERSPLRPGSQDLVNLQLESIEAAVTRIRQ